MKKYFFCVLLLASLWLQPMCISAQEQKDEEALLSPEVSRTESDAQTIFSDLELSADTDEQPKTEKNEEKKEQKKEKQKEKGNEEEEEPSAEEIEPEAAALTQTATAGENFGNISSPPDAETFLKGMQGQYETDLFTGSATFRYPLWIPPGRNGMQPRLSLNYSSSYTNLNSPLGIGWSLPMSAIYRTTPRGIDKLYIENDFSAEVFGNYQELIATDSANGQYAARVESDFSRYSFMNNAWTMRNARGTLYTFGASAASRQTDPNDPSRVYKWLLEKVEDTNGNFMTFTYYQDNGQVYPDVIRYTGHGTESGIYEVRFVLSPNANPTTSYKTGFEVQTNFVISAVEIYSSHTGSASKVRAYDLTYDEDSYVINQLTGLAVQAETLSLPPIQFDYYDSTSSVGLLKTITYPTGGKQVLTYKPSTAYRTPAQGLFNSSLPFTVQTVHTSTLDSVLSDTLQPIATTTYDYSGGHYYFDALDAYTREYAGFHKVSITDPEANVRTLFFHQSEFSADNSMSSLKGEFEDHISKKGRIFREELRDANENLFELTLRKWDKTELPADHPEWKRYFAKLTREVNASYDGNFDSRAVANEYRYDQYGNVVETIEYGEVSLVGEDGSFTDIGTDMVTTMVEYAQNTTMNIISLPKKEERYDQNGTILSELKSYYDGSSTLGSVTQGNLTKSEQLIAAPNTYRTTALTYNSYGLPVTFTNARNYSTAISYDIHNLLPATITNAKNHIIQYAYDYRFGFPHEITDPNGAKTITTFDALGRVTQRKKSDPANPTQEIIATRHEYNTTAFPHSVTMTTVFDSQISPAETGALEKITYFDGFGRLLQSRTEAEGSDQYMVSSILYDARGNIQKETLPVFASGLNFETLNGTDLGTEYLYDAINRVIAITDPVGTTTTAYDQWTQQRTDANGHRKDFVNDAYGNLITVREYLNGTLHSTHYEYDGNNNLSKITDAEGNVRSFTHDLLGRRIASEDIHTPNDATFGTWTFAYDANGNLISSHDPKGQTLLYSYDELDRVLTEDFTGQSGIEVAYTYDMGSYAIGRLSSVDSSEVEKEFTYDILGRVTTETKNILSLFPAQSLSTAFTYSLAGNPKTITHPDGMVVSYKYDTAGQLESVQKDGANIVSSITYGPAGLLEQINYANGVSTSNIYDIHKLYRLTNRTTVNAANTKLQDISYTFDPVGNITQITDASATNAAKTAVYTYDDLDRLLSATVSNTANGQDYTKSFSYNILGNILSKSDEGVYSYTGGDMSTSNNTLANPHAVTDINGIVYSYDENGNLLSDSIWNHTWDYKDRISSSSNGNTTVLYAYDEGGQRILKENTTTGKKTIYVNQYYEIEDGVGKNFIYAGDMKIATVQPEMAEQSAPVITKTLYEDAEDGLTDGWDMFDNKPAGAVISNEFDPEQGQVIRLQGDGLKNGFRLRHSNLTPFGNTSEFFLQADIKFSEPFSILSFLQTVNGNRHIKYSIEAPSGCVLSGNTITCGLDTVFQNGTWQEFIVDLQTDLEAAEPGNTITSVQNFRVRGSGMVDNVKLLSDIPPEDVATTSVPEIVYHHEDHLSGSNVDTDEQGNILQLLDYFPYGSVRLDEKSGNYENDYKFTGKELDEDTGLYYYEARYYDADIARFVSIDPIANFSPEQFLHDPQQMNGYSYVRNNPLKYVDPTGLKLSKENREKSFEEASDNINSKEFRNLLENEGNAAGLDNIIDKAFELASNYGDYSHYGSIDSEEKFQNYYKEFIIDGLTIFSDSVRTSSSLDEGEAESIRVANLPSGLTGNFTPDSFAHTDKLQHFAYSALLAVKYSTKASFAAGVAVEFGQTIIFSDSGSDPKDIVANRLGIMWGRSFFGENRGGKSASKFLEERTVNGKSVEDYYQSD